MKQLIQNVLKPLGYQFCKLSQNWPFAPFVRDFNFPGASFRMWIANEDAVEWYGESWEKHVEFQLLKQLVQPGDRILDIGSHHGFLAMLFARWTGQDGFVLGVEANPQNALVDNAQITLNGDFGNLKFIHAAAGAAKGKLKMNHQHNGSVCRNGEDGILVDALTGDALDKQFGPFNVLKIDVEGYEIEVLKGCKNILGRFPKLALEIHFDQLEEMGHKIDDVLALINAGHYRGEMIVRPLHWNERSPFDSSALCKLKKEPAAPYLAANVFLEPIMAVTDIASERLAA